MARYRKIDPRIWNDEKISSLSDCAQLAFLYVLTHPLMTSLGALRGTPEGLAGEKYGWEESREGFRKAFLEACLELSEKGVIKIDKKGVIFAPNFLKYNRPESPNVIKAWKGSLDLLPECSLMSEVLTQAKSCIDAMSEGYREAFQEAFAEDFAKACLGGVEKPSAKTMPNQEQEQEQEQEQDIYEQPDGCSWSTPAAPTPELALNEEEKIRPVTKAPIPYQRIVDLYNTKLGPYLRVCKVLNPTRRSNIRARWTDVAKAVKSADPEDVINGFSAYFDKVARSDFLMGKCPASPGHSRRFSADFDWIMNSTNFTCIYEGKYENGRKPR